MTRERKSDQRARALAIFEALSAAYPVPKTFLIHDNPFQLLVAVMLSAQCTDDRVNLVTPALFKAFNTPRDFADAEVSDIVKKIRSITYFNAKALHIQQTSRKILEDFGGEVPQTLEALVQLPGVGRKTANVVLGQIFGVPGITVDTHVNRVSRRLGFSKQAGAEQIERDLMALWPKSTWIDYSTLMIVHGRKVCDARKPKCGECMLKALCPSSTK